MKQWLDFWEKCKGKKGSPVLIGLLVGLLLLVITWPDNSSKKQNTQTKTNAPAVENNVRNTEDLAQERTQRMEQRLEEVLREVDGVGEVKVMITLRSCGAYIVEKGTRTSNSQNTQDQSGDKSTANAQDFEENTVFEKQENGAETPYVKEITEPEVEGVIVAAEGGNNAKTAADITDAVVALFGIEVHKIKVMKKV